MTIKFTNKAQKTTTIAGKKMTAQGILNQYAAAERNQGGNLMMDNETEISDGTSYVTIRSICGSFVMLTK